MTVPEGEGGEGNAVKQPAQPSPPPPWVSVGLRSTFLAGFAYYEGGGRFNSYYNSTPKGPVTAIERVQTAYLFLIVGGHVHAPGGNMSQAPLCSR